MAKSKSPSGTSRGKTWGWRFSLRALFLVVTWFACFCAWAKCFAAQISSVGWQPGNWGLLALLLLIVAWYMARVEGGSLTACGLVGVALHLAVLNVILDFEFVLSHMTIESVDTTPDRIKASLLSGVTAPMFLAAFPIYRIALHWRRERFRNVQWQVLSFCLAVCDMVLLAYFLTAPWTFSG